MSLAKILVPTDFSPAAHHAQQRAMHLALQTGAELHVVHVLPEESVFRRLFHRNDIDYSQMFKGAEHALQSACAEIARDSGITATWDVLNGHAAQTIATAADAFAADIIVAGGRGEHASFPHAPALGGTAFQLMTHAATPLLLVRRAAEEPYNSMVLTIECEETAQ